MSAAQCGDVELKVTANGYSHHERKDKDYHESTSFEIGIIIVVTIIRNCALILF